MQVFLPDFLARDLGLNKNTNNCNTNGSIYIPKSNSFKTPKIKQIIKKSQLKDLKPQTSKSLPTKCSQITELILQKRNNQKYYSHKIDLFANYCVNQVNPLKSLECKLHNSVRKTKTFHNPQLREQNRKTQLSQTIPHFFLAKSFNFQFKTQKTSKRKELSVNSSKVENQRISYRNNLRKLSTKKLLNLSNNQYRPWSPSKHQAGQQQLR